MLPTLATLLFVYLQLSQVLGLQIGSVLPLLVEDISSIIFGHNAYVDQNVHHPPHSPANHDQWHQRHVFPFMNGSSVAYMTLSAPTGYLGTLSLGSLPATASASVYFSGTLSLVSAIPSASVSMNFSSNTTLAPSSSSSASATALQANRLASLLGHTEDLEADTSAKWNAQTEAACSTALIALHGVATNPSGIAACYNIESLNNSTGVFEVDLRLYRIAAPSSGWVKLNPSSVGVGLSYVNATVSAAPTKAEKIKREDQTLPWLPAERDEAADMYIRRSIGAPPRKLGGMNFVGTVDSGALVELKDSNTAQVLLTPMITLSGVEQDGTPINTRFSTQDASFVNGVFASTKTTNVNEFVLPGTQLVGFPLGLIISSVWAVLYLMTMGYGTMSRYQARESYRRRVKTRFSGDTITKRKMRWA